MRQVPSLVNEGRKWRGQEVSVPGASCPRLCYPAEHGGMNVQFGPDVLRDAPCLSTLGPSR